MRLWSLHPKYLDPAGLVALWREALLAQAVLGGKTSGYRHHPQLIRFRECSRPEAGIAEYLRVVQAEATARGYNFDRTKISAKRTAAQITINSGQLDFEWRHLCRKLESRNPRWLANFGSVRAPEIHPVFRLVRGPIEEWEIISG